MTIDLTQNWRTIPLLVLDFEATSADPSTCEPVEVAAVRFEDGRPVARFSSLLKPSGLIPAESTAIHKITDEMVKDSPTLADVAGELAKLAVGAVPVAYNSPYDRTVLHRYISGKDVPAFDPGFHWLDVYVVVASQDKHVSGKGRLRLVETCKRHGVPLSDAHRALEDAEATGALLHVLMGDSQATMQSLLTRCARARDEQEADYRAWKKKALEADRLVWRQYACAALTGMFASKDGGWDHCIKEAGEAANRMLTTEKERFNNG